MNLNHNQCKSIQEDLLSADNPMLLLEADIRFKNHIDECKECHSFTQSLLQIHQQMQRSPVKQIKPNRYILSNMLKLLELQQGFTLSARNSLWNSIRQIIQYRIPVYQAISGLVVMIMLIFFLSGILISPEIPWANGDRSVKIEGQINTDLYAIDSLTLLKPERGQNAREDSVLVGFLVPTL